MAERWVIGRVQVTQGDVDHVSVARACQSEVEARALLSSYPEEGHAWSGLVCYRVLIQRGAAFLSPDGTPYYPKAERGF